MTDQEKYRIFNMKPGKNWVPDYDYDPGYVSDEENEELTKILESLTEDDLETVFIENVNRFDPSISKVLYLKEEI